MQFCISITDTEALKKWRSIPKQKRSQYIQNMLLGGGDTKIDELKEMLIKISSSSNESSYKTVDTGVIDEILDM